MIISPIQNWVLLPIYERACSIYNAVTLLPYEFWYSAKASVGFCQGRWYGAKNYHCYGCNPLISSLKKKDLVVIYLRPTGANRGMVKPLAELLLPYKKIATYSLSYSGNKDGIKKGLALYTKIRKEYGKHIVFIGHSMGGIDLGELVKKIKDKNTRFIGIGARRSIDLKYYSTWHRLLYSLGVVNDVEKKFISSVIKDKRYYALASNLDWMVPQGAAFHEVFHKIAINGYGHTGIWWGSLPWIMRFLKEPLRVSGAPR